MPTIISKDYNKWLKKYEELSKITCVSCGERGVIDYKKSWLEPLCESCNKIYNNT